MERLYYADNYLSEDEMKNINEYLENEKWTPITANAKSRKVIHYGHTYAYNRSGLGEVPPIPDCLKNLVSASRVNKFFPELKFKEMAQLIINEYKVGQGISAHIDHPKQFGPVIICLSLGSDIEILFSKGEVKIPVQIKMGSIYIMTGPSRYEFTHSILPRKYDNKVIRKDRISLTYRTVL